MVISLSGCPDDGDGSSPPECADFDADACTPQFAPEFDRVFEQVLMPRCGVPGSACHAEAGAEGADGGLVITDVDSTHEILLNGFVEPSDVACSPLLVRMNTDDSDFLMPPGSQPLDEDVRCSIAQWIASGAQR